MSIGLNELGYTERLYVLAFDHRGSFEKMVGDHGRVPGAKTLIWEGFQLAVGEGVPKSIGGIFVDEQHGTPLPRRRRRTATSSRCLSRSQVRSIQIRVRRRVRREIEGSTRPARFSSLPGR
jgi:hypothetical protein